MVVGGTDLLRFLGGYFNDFLESLFFGLGFFFMDRSYRRASFRGAGLGTNFFFGFFLRFVNGFNGAFVDGSVRGVGIFVLGTFTVLVSAWAGSSASLLAANGSQFLLSWDTGLRGI